MCRRLGRVLHESLGGLPVPAGETREWGRKVRPRPRSLSDSLRLDLGQQHLRKSGGRAFFAGSTTFGHGFVQGGVFHMNRAEGWTDRLHSADGSWYCRSRVRARVTLNPHH